MSHCAIKWSTFLPLHLPILCFQCRILFPYISLSLCFRIGFPLTCGLPCCSFVLVLLFTCPIIVLQLPNEALLNHVLEAPGLHEWFEGSTEVGNPDALLLALKLREKISDDSPMFSKLLPNPFSPSNLFTADHLSSLANCFKVLFICFSCLLQL